MQMGQSCCDEQDITDGDQYTDRVEDGVGNVPQNIIDAGYAEDAADWDGFDDYKCMIAHVTVNQLDARLLELAPIVDQYGAVFGGLAAVASVLAVIFGTGGLAIVFGMVAGVGAVSLLYNSLMEGALLEILAAKVVSNHDLLTCAIYHADGDVNALIDLNAKIDLLFTVPEALILKNMNIGPTLKALYAGRYDQQDIADILFDAGYELDDFDCPCAEGQLGQYRYEYAWPIDDFDYFINLDSWEWRSGQYIRKFYQSGARVIYTDAHKMRDWAGLPHEGDIRVRRIGVNCLNFYDRSNLRVSIEHTGGTFTKNTDVTTSYVTYILNLDDEEQNIRTEEYDKIIIGAYFESGNDWFYINDVFIEFDDYGAY